MSIPSNKLDFVDHNVAKSFINKSFDTGLDKEKNQGLGSVLKVFKNLWHKTEVTFRQLGNLFEEGWITNDTIKNKLITKIGEFKDEIDALSYNKASLESTKEVEDVLAKMSVSQADMKTKIGKMEEICKLFRKRGDQTNAQEVETQLTILNTKVDQMLSPIANLKAKMQLLEKNEKNLRLALEKQTNAEEIVLNLQRVHPELAKLKNDLQTAQSQKGKLEAELAALGGEKKIDQSQKKELQERLQELDKTVSKSTEQIKQFISDNKHLKEANEKLTHALNDATETGSAYKTQMEKVHAERADFLKLTESSMKVLESDLNTKDNKLKEKDKKIADVESDLKTKENKLKEKDQKIADLESQLAEAKKLLEQVKEAKIDDESLAISSPEKLIEEGMEREKQSIVGSPKGLEEGIAVEESPKEKIAEELPQVVVEESPEEKIAEELPKVVVKESPIEEIAVEEFSQVVDVPRLNKLGKAMSNFMEVAKETNLILNKPKLNSIRSDFARFEDDALAHAGDFFKEIEGSLVRLGMAKWNENKTGVKIRKHYPEVKEAYGKALKAFYKIEGAQDIKDVLPVSNESKKRDLELRKRDADQLRSQREKIELIETPFVSNLEGATTILGNAMQKLVRVAEKSGLPLSDIQAKAQGPWNFDLDTVDTSTQIFTEIEASLVKEGIAEPSKKRVGVTIDKDKYPKLEKAYENALTAYDEHMDHLNKFYAYDDLIAQNNEKLHRLIIDAEFERGDEPLDYNQEREDLSKYDQIINKFKNEGVKLSDKDILGFQGQVLEAIQKRYKTDEFPAGSDVAMLYKEANDGVTNLEFVKQRHEGFKRGEEVSSEELRERRIEERSQKFERDFPGKKIKESVAERLDKPMKKASKDKYADYESRSADVKFIDPRTTSREQRTFLKKEAEKAKQSKVSVEQKHVLNAVTKVTGSIERLNENLKGLVRIAKAKDAIGKNTAWNYNEEQFELLDKSKSAPSRENVLQVAGDYLKLIKEEFEASEIAFTEGNDITFNEDADPDLVSKYKTVLEDMQNVTEDLAVLKSVKEAKELAKQLKGEVEKALLDLLEAAEASGMPMANPLFNDFPDPLQDLAKFKRKGKLRVKDNSLAGAADHIFNMIKYSLEESQIDVKDDRKIEKAFNRVSTLLAKLN